MASSHHRGGPRQRAPGVPSGRTGLGLSFCQRPDSRSRSSMSSRTMSDTVTPSSCARALMGSHKSSAMRTDLVGVLGWLGMSVGTVSLVIHLPPMHAQSKVQHTPEASTLAEVCCTRNKTNVNLCLRQSVSAPLRVGNAPDRGDLGRPWCGPPADDPEAQGYRESRYCKCPHHCVVHRDLLCAPTWTPGEAPSP